MVKINNQRKAFLDMLAWSEGLKRTDQKTHEIMVVTSFAGRLFTGRADPRKLVTLNPKLKSTGAGRYQLCPLVGCLPQAATPKLLSEKSGRCGIAAD